MTATESKWAKRIDEWLASGLTADQFAKGKDFRPKTLLWHRWRKRRDEGLKEEVDGATVVTRQSRTSVPKAFKRTGTDSSRRTSRRQLSVQVRSGKQVVSPIPIAKVVRTASFSPRTRDVVVEIGVARISVSSGFDAMLLKDVVRAIGEAT
jgi:hypothetical protein